MKTKSKIRYEFWRSEFKTDKPDYVCHTEEKKNIYHNKTKHKVKYEIREIAI